MTWLVNFFPASLAWAEIGRAFGPRFHVEGSSTPGVQRKMWDTSVTSTRSDSIAKRRTSSSAAPRRPTVYAETASKPVCCNRKAWFGEKVSSRRNFTREPRCPHRSRAGRHTPEPLSRARSAIEDRRRESGRPFLRLQAFPSACEIKPGFA
jgi:hypothetical protein